MSRERKEEEWHREFEKFIRSSTVQNKPQFRAVGLAIKEILSQWESHHAGEEVWAKPAIVDRERDRSIVSRFLWRAEVAAADPVLVLQPAAEIVQYLEGLVFVTLMGDDLLENDVFDQNAPLEELFLRPFKDFSADAWADEYGNHPDTIPWAAEPADDEPRAPDGRPLVELAFTADALARCRHWPRLRAVRDLLLRDRFLDHMFRLDQYCGLRTIEHGLAARLLWFLAASIVGRKQQNERELHLDAGAGFWVSPAAFEDLCAVRAGAVNETSVDNAWRKAAMRIRGARYRQKTPATLPELDARVHRLRAVIEELRKAKRWAQETGALAQVFARRMPAAGASPEEATS